MRKDRTDIWAQLNLSQHDQEKIRSFFTEEVGINASFLLSNMHITVYHSRRPMPGVSDIKEDARVIIPAEDFRFMVMAPGGENHRAELDPGRRKVGVRIHRQSAATPEIHSYRERLTSYETSQILGGRMSSNKARSAFGARSFQPHMSLLRAGSGIDRDLKPIGAAFRQTLGNLTFDSFSIKVVRKVRTSSFA